MGFSYEEESVDYRCQELRQNQMTMPAERNKMIRNLFIKRIDVNFIIKATSRYINIYSLGQICVVSLSDASEE